MAEDAKPPARRGRPPKAEADKRKQVRDRLHYLNAEADMHFDASQLSFEERRLLVVMADPRLRTDKWSIKQICEKAEISYHSYYKAMQNKDFLAAQNSVVHAAIKQAILPMVRAGVKFAMKGDFRFWQAIMRMGGQIDVTDDDRNNPREINIIFKTPDTLAKPRTVVDAEIVEDTPKPAGGFTLSIPDADS